MIHKKSIYFCVNICYTKNGLRKTNPSLQDADRICRNGKSFFVGEKENEMKERSALCMAFKVIGAITVVAAIAAAGVVIYKKYIAKKKEQCCDCCDCDCEDFGECECECDCDDICEFEEAETAE